jgi:hypothetical protein
MHHSFELVSSDCHQCGEHSAPHFNIECGHEHRIFGTNITHNPGDFIYWDDTLKSYLTAVEGKCDLMVLRVDPYGTWFEAANIGEFQIKNFTLQGTVYIDYVGELTETATDTKVGFIENGHLYLSIQGASSGGGEPYTLPIASETVLGGIKIGSTLEIDAGGVLDVGDGTFIKNQKLAAQIANEWISGSIYAGDELSLAGSNSNTLSGYNVSETIVNESRKTPPSYDEYEYTSFYTNWIWCSINSTKDVDAGEYLTFAELLLVWPEMPTTYDEDFYVQWLNTNIANSKVISNYEYLTLDELQTILGGAYLGPVNTIPIIELNGKGLNNVFGSYNVNIIKSILNTVAGSSEVDIGEVAASVNSESNTVLGSRYGTIKGNISGIYGNSVIGSDGFSIINSIKCSIFASTSTVLGNVDSRSENSVVVSSNGSQLLHGIDSTLLSSDNVVVSKDSYRSIISGYYVILNEAVYDSIVKGIQLTLNGEVYNSLVFVSSSTLEVTSSIWSSLILGDGLSISSGLIGSIIVAESVAITGNLSNVAVFGERHLITNSSYLLVSGANHEISESSHACISGDSNKILNYSYQSSVFGSGNTISDYSNAASVFGARNTITDYSYYSMIGGGQDNLIENHSYMSSIVNGYENKISTYCYQSSILGGSGNIIDEYSYVSAILSGQSNHITNNSYGATILGGFALTINGCGYSYILSGDNNTINASSNCYISHGHVNSIVGGSQGSYILGGQSNTITSSSKSIILGGSSNNITANDTLVYGTGNTSTFNGQIIFGQYNKNLTDSILEIGGGTSSEVADRKNIFRITRSGISEQLGLIIKPQTDNPENIVDGQMFTKTDGLYIQINSVLYKVNLTQV